MKKQWFGFAAAVMVFLNLKAFAGMVGYWDFNEGTGTVLHDLTGNGNNGTIYGATWVSGIEGDALNFNGTSNYVIVPNAPSLNFDTTLAFTISVWVKGPAQQLNGAGIVNKGTATLEQYCIDVCGLGYRFYVRNASATVTMAISNVFPGNNWDHVAAVFDKSQGIMKIFVNGVLKSSQIPPTTLLSTADPLLFGSRKDIGSSVYNLPFNGAMDNVRMYNRALTDSEISFLYKNPRAQLLYPFLIPVPSPSVNRLPTLFWHSVGQAATYWLQVDTTKSFTSPCIRTSLLDTTYKVLVALPIDTIYWQVIAGINDTTLYYSEIGSFLIQSPNVPILIPYTPKVTTERQPVLRWHPVAGASVYTIEIGSDAGFTISPYIIPIADTQYSQTVNLPYGPTYWRVKSDLAAAWSTTDMFQIVPDSIPILIRYDGGSVSSATPQFAWHPVAGATSYTIKLADNPSFAGGYTVPLSDTTYAPSVGLANGFWFWKVSCSRNSSLFSPADSLEVRATNLRETTLAGAAKPFVNVIRSRNGFSILMGGCETGEVQAELYSARGTLAAVFTNANSAQTMISWNGKDRLGRDCGNGIYILRVRMPGKIMTERIVVQR